MATGPQNYAEAEKRLARLPDLKAGSDEAIEALLEAIARGLLASAAATALSENGAMPGVDFDAWAKAASADPTQSGRPAVWWWLDDGHENPGVPELYLTQGAALEAGAKQFRDANFDQQDVHLTWTLFEEENGPEALELVAAGRCTGIIVRPVRPKAAP
jgi:hypothetical protein